MDRTFAENCNSLKVVGLFVFAVCAWAGPTPVGPVPNPCTPRFLAGSLVQNPPALYSSNGVLNVRFSYQQTADTAGRLLHCLMTDTGLQEPTLHVNPGDTLTITVTNNTPQWVPGPNDPPEETFIPPNCGDSTLQYTPPPTGITSTGSSMNIHYHGTNVTPQCGGDNVTKTIINSGTTFQYSFAFPTDEPPGLYWYHPHIHGLAERDLLGGATGALIVDGIQNVKPAVAGLREKILVMRDQPQVQGLPEGPGNCGVNVPFQDISVNYVPIDSHATFKPDNTLKSITFTPAVLRMQPGETQFWRVTNSGADTILDLQVLYDGVPQTLQVVAIDAVPVNSQEVEQEDNNLIPVTRFRLPIASRVEFLVSAPGPNVKVAQFVTNNINTGPQGDCDPSRPIFNIQLANDSNDPNDNNVGLYTGLQPHQKFGGLDDVEVSTTRVFQFSEIQPTQFFITETAVNSVPTGTTPVVFDNNNPPAVITKQGSVEKWIIQNVAQENHEFHMHQIHFKVLSQDNFPQNGAQPAPGIDGQLLDMVEVPFWVGTSGVPIPQVQLLMDFRGMDIGDFVYHCHILSHEDLGMMAIIRVTP